MKFLAKRADSAILEEDLRYDSKGNSRLKELLLAEQRGFCAYSEKLYHALDSVDIEHFDASKKNTPDDDYYNYYAVVHKKNQRKRRAEKHFKGASFFVSRFFQTPGEFARRIQYVPEDHVYEAIDPRDTEARDLIQYLGFNANPLVQLRRRHVERVTQHIHESAKRPERYFADFPDELSFITACEAALEVDLEPLLDSDFYSTFADLS